MNFDVRIKIDGKKRHASSFMKYLGVYLDENLKWSKHVDVVSSKLRKANGALSKLRHVMPKESFVSVYYSIFQSRISYACQIWAQRETPTTTKRIFLLQKRAVRILSNANFVAHTTPLFLDLRILKLFDHVKYLNTLFVYNLLKGKLPLALHNTFYFDHFETPNITRGRKVKDLWFHLDLRLFHMGNSQYKIRQFMAGILYRRIFVLVIYHSWLTRNSNFGLNFTSSPVILINSPFYIYTIYFNHMLYLKHQQCKLTRKVATSSNRYFQMEWSPVYVNFMFYIRVLGTNKWITLTLLTYQLT